MLLGAAQWHVAGVDVAMGEPTEQSPAGSVTNVMRRLPTSPRQIRRDDVSRASPSTRWRGNCLSGPSSPAWRTATDRKRATCAVVNTAQCRV